MAKKWNSPPEMAVDPDKRYKAEMVTSMGSMTISLDPAAAPKTVNNFVFLAREGFYDGVTFHRIIKDFVIQGGDPTGTGTGGPGYTIAAEFNDRLHQPGTLSMARTSDPNSAGSQFFLCLEKVPYLDNQYTAFGKTADDESLAVVKSIGAVKTDSGDRPLEPVSIKSAKVHELPL